MIDLPGNILAGRRSALPIDPGTPPQSMTRYQVGEFSKFYPHNPDMLKRCYSSRSQAHPCSIAAHTHLVSTSRKNDYFKLLTPNSQLNG